MKFETTRSTHFEDTTAHDIVVYTFFNKKLVKYRGDAFFREGAGVCGFRAKVGKDASLIGRFYTTLFSGKEKRFAICGKPGIIYNTTVWYEQDADEEARELFIKYEEEKIKKLEQEIVKYKDWLEIIKNSNIVNEI